MEIHKCFYYIFYDYFSNLYNLFKPGTGRQTKVNAILTYIQNEMNEKEYYLWRENFTTEPELLNHTKVINWLSKIKGIAMSSDAFFPFPDGIENAAKAGAYAIVQPGGSVKDSEVIEAADRLGLVMLFTGTRHFYH